MDPNVDALLWNGRARDSHGTEKIYGVVPAIVVAIDDKKEKRHQQGAVQIRFPWLTDGGTAQDLLPWARSVTWASGHDGDDAPCGWVSTPQIHDEVLVGFENGDIHRPYVLGQLWNPKDGSGGSSGGAAGGAGGGGGGGSAAQAGGSPGAAQQAGGSGDAAGDGAAPGQPAGSDAAPGQAAPAAAKDAPANADDRPPAAKGRPAPAPAAKSLQPSILKPTIKVPPGVRNPAALKDPDKPGPAKKVAPAKPPVKKAEPKKDIIRKGEVLFPPQDDKAEAKWFERLERTTPEELQPGDILLRKVYHGTHSVKEAQRLFRDGKGSNCSVHAMLYIGDGQIAEASGKGVHIRALKTVTQIVWRPTDPAQARAAVATARWLDTLGLKYSTRQCFEAGPRSSSWGPQAKSRAALVASRKKFLSEVMCSAHVAFCYQGIAGRPYILLDALRTAPIRLEDYLNSHPHLFRFEGAMDGSGADEDDSVIEIPGFAGGVHQAVGAAVEQAGDAGRAAADAAAKAAEAAAKQAAEAKRKAEEAAKAAAKQAEEAAKAAAQAAAKKAEEAAKAAAKKAEEAAKKLGNKFKKLF